MLGSAHLWVKIVASFHVVFAFVELTLWKTLTVPLGVCSAAEVEATARFGRNIGFYNGILAACLFWMLSAKLSPPVFRSLGTVLLVGIISAGVFGGLTIQWAIPLFQSIPAAIALYVLRSAPSA